jgi:hypothetical protein
MLCADMVDVSWMTETGHHRRSTALLEDISVHGACLQFEFELPLDTQVAIEHGATRMLGSVRYCVYREIGYFVGIRFQEGSEWSRESFTPDHMLDLEQLVFRSLNKASRRVN